MLNDQSNISEYLLYSRLQDTLMTLGTNALLKVNVNLYSEKKNNQREYYRGEVQYISRSGKLSRKVTRKIEGVLLIENMKPFNGKKDVVAIRPGDLELMRIVLLPWLEHILKEFNEIYSLQDGKLYIAKEKAAMEIALGPAKIWFKPGIYSNTYTNEISPCLNLSINDPDNISKIPYDSVYAFMHIIRLFQIHQYAATMIAAFDQAPVGLNLYDITNSQILNSLDQYKYEEPEYIKKKRAEYKKGFFDTEIENRK